ncbi:unnamed protein product [Bursaphelenchus okinawaensis]|uniref:Uncharacterized protein n=1 Tax=Bursaphelenchus okinawaensis TaxID=465554 RepID=A0A811KMH1_9BILA|nr:unnamed protein product [Bursaphelenchus okinawaensis]CAG9106031.1 unnamed protein product [Bursaphelenchus okinawaensis]
MFSHSVNGGKKVLCIFQDFSLINNKSLCNNIIKTALAKVDENSEFMWIREAEPEFDFKLDDSFFAPAYERIRLCIGKNEEIVQLLEKLLNAERLAQFSDDGTVVRYVLVDLSTAKTYDPFTLSAMTSLLLEVARNIQSFCSTLEINVVMLLPLCQEVARARSRRDRRKSNCYAENRVISTNHVLSRPILVKKKIPFAFTCSKLLCLDWKKHGDNKILLDCSERLLYQSGTMASSDDRAVYYGSQWNVLGHCILRR